MSDHTQSVLDINLSAMARNWSKFSKLGAKTTAAVIKADAYGLGAKEAARAFQDVGCKDFFVAHFDEAIKARSFISASSRIFVLNGVFSNQSEIMAEFDLIPIINSIEQYEIWENQNLPFALHIDTGMNRLGLRFDEYNNFEKISKNANLKLVLSHLACGSDPNSSKNITQLSLFKDACEYFECEKSLSASGGALLGDDYLFDLIRPGIGLYGGNPHDFGDNFSEAVVNLKSPILQTRIVKKGESIGYGASFIAKKNMNIATVALGYADGFLRSASNSGFAIIKNTKCKILGRVSMDLIAIDISNIEGVKFGDEVEFLGKNALIDDQANCANTISYEFLTRLGNRFKRNYFYE